MTNRNIDNLAGCDVRHGTLPEGGGRVPDPDFHHVATGLYFWPGAVPGLRDERMSFGSNPYYEKTTRMNTEPTPKREFTGVWIPAIIWERADLNCTEKCLLAEIHALGGHRGNCFAGNEYLGKQVGGLSPVRIGAIISKLKGLGLIRQVSFDGRVRKLQTLFDAKCGNEADPSKMRGRSNQKRGGGPIENEGALIVEGKIEKKIEEEEITPADAGDVTKPESEPVVEKPKAPVKIFAEQWWGAYKRHNGMPYSPPNRAADFAAAKRITSNGRSVAELIELAEFAWEPGNLEPFYWSQAQSIAGFALRLTNIQAAFVAKRGRKLSAEEREENVRNGQAHLNALADW